MLWFDELAARLEGPQVVNDSKTPSGPVHVGSLRGVLIHDAVYRALCDRQTPAQYRFGVDDYDPLDELPPTGADIFRPFLGMPLCNVPAPQGSEAKNLAEYYVKDFFDVFAELGVSAELYRMHDIYRSGGFDAEIDTILRKADIVRKIDREIAGARRDDDWYPFQVVCERCGKIGTTKVSFYDGDLVTYQCVPRLVKWAEGCGHTGKVSPFGGNGKLSWKLEWVAKWNNFPVTVEGAGKDHNTKGGSRDVAVRCLREIFDKDAPANIPYEFFLVGGAKMSSSRGVGVSAKEMSDLLPPELLRFLMIRSHPKQVVDFSPEQEKIVRLFSDFDRMRNRAVDAPSYPNEARLYEIVQVSAEPNYYSPPFDMVLSLVQMPHLDPAHEIEKIRDKSFSIEELQHLDQRLESARYWLQNFAHDEDRFEIQPTLPKSHSSLSPAQLGFLHIFAAKLLNLPWNPSELQVCIFDAARLTPISQPEAFAALYLMFLDRQSGPKAGNLFAFLNRTFVIDRLREASIPSRIDFWTSTGTSDQEMVEWLGGVNSKINGLSAATFFDGHEDKVGSDQTSYVRGMGVIDLRVKLTDGKVHIRRSISSSFEGYNRTLAQEAQIFETSASEFLGDLERRFSVDIETVSFAGDVHWLDYWACQEITR